MKYLKSKSGQLFVKDLGNGYVISIQLHKEIAYEKMIVFAGVNLDECPKEEVEMAFKATLAIFNNLL